MPVGIGSTQITGISVVANSTDAASKEYADNASSSGGTPSITGQENEFLFTDGSTSSWEPIQGYVEYTTSGNYTFTVPTQASELFIEATGAGGGGAPGTATVTSYSNKGEFWFVRTSGTTNAISGTNVFGPSVIYDGTNYIFANASGTIISSTDSITWTLRTSGFGSTTIQSIAYGSDKTFKYVIVGNGGVISSSTDSIRWTLRTSGFGTSVLSTISYGNGFYFTASNTTASVRVSTDSIVWTLRTSSVSGNANSSVYGDGYYIVVGSNGYLKSSTDSINWILRTTGFGATDISTVTYANNLFVIGSLSSFVRTSTDIITWVSRTSGIITIADIGSLYYGEGYYVAAISGSSGPIIFSTDGIVWIQRTSIVVNAPGAIYGNGIHVKGGLSGVISASPYPKGFSGSGGGGGASVGWKLSKSQISSSTVTVNVGSGGSTSAAGAATTVSWTSPGGTFSVTANGGGGGTNIATNNTISGGTGGTITSLTNYVYASAGTSGGDGGYFESSKINLQGIGSNSPDATNSYQVTGGGSGASSILYGELGKRGGTINYYGNTYPQVDVFLNAPNYLPISGLSYGGGGNGGGAQYGATAWVLRTSGFGTSAYVLGYGNNVYIMAGLNNNLSSSTDAITWVVRTTGFASTTDIYGYSHDGINHVLYTGIGNIAASTNGIFWTLRTSSTTNRLGNDINTYPGSIYANNLHMTGGSNGTFLISTDSIAWTLRTTGFGATGITAVAYADSVYIISGGSNGLLRTSTDNIAWTLRTSGTTASVINSINYFNSNFYYFTGGGTIFNSTNGIAWTSIASGLTNLYASAVSNDSLIIAGNGLVYSSVDGLTWSARTIAVGGDDNALASIYANGLFLSTYIPSRLLVADASFIGNGGNGFRGGGGGGGAYNTIQNTTSSAGTGGDGYVRISWQ